MASTMSHLGAPAAADGAPRAAEVDQGRSLRRRTSGVTFCSMDGSARGDMPGGVEQPLQRSISSGSVSTRMTGISAMVFRRDSDNTIVDRTVMDDN